MHARSIFSIATTACTLAALMACGGSTPEAPPPAAPPKAEPFDIGMVTFAGYAPLYLAKEKGFFGDLDVRLERIEDVASIRAAVERGDLEAYLATPDIAQDSNTKPPGKAVWAIDESNGGDGVVVAPGIESLGDLKGKQVAAEPGLPPNFVLMYLLHKNGMSMADVQYQDMTTQNAATAFSSGAVDAAGVYEPFLSTAKNQREGSKIVISSADTPGMIVDLIFAGDDTLAHRREDVATVITGWEKAVDHIAAHPEESAKIMAASFGLDVAEFNDIVGGITWLDREANDRLFGTAAEPGPLYGSFDEVNAVLKRNRSAVYESKATDYLLRDFLADK